VRRIRGGEPVTGVHVLFIQPFGSGPARGTAPTTQGQPVLTVTETEKGLRRQRHQFRGRGQPRALRGIARAANRNGLRIGAPLLAVATTGPGESAVTPNFGLRSVRHKLFAGVLVTSLAHCSSRALPSDLRPAQLSHAQVNDLTTQAELIGRASAAALQFDDRKFAAEQPQPAQGAAEDTGRRHLQTPRAFVWPATLRPGPRAKIFPRSPTARGSA